MFFGHKSAKTRKKIEQVLILDNISKPNRWCSLKKLAWFKQNVTLMLKHPWKLDISLLQQNDAKIFSNTIRKH